MQQAPLSLAAFAVLALAGCDMRSGETEPPTSRPGAGESIAPPAASASGTPAASIIREDALPEPIVEQPPEPVRATVPFAQGGSDLSQEAVRILAGVLASDAMTQGWPITLRGHTDSVGEDSANLRAARKRAEAVAAWLAERGVNEERIRVIALGEQNPVAPNALSDGEPNEPGRARNRRVELEIAPLAGPPAPVEAGAREDAQPPTESDEPA
jgi:OOP family OmpA-OmpF porin